MFALLLVRILWLCKRLAWRSSCWFNLRLCGAGTPRSSALPALERKQSGPCGGRSFWLAPCSALPKTETEA